MEETLVCSQCSKKWKRQTSRGRKPIVCPKCVATNTQPPESIQKKTTVFTEPKIENLAAQPEKSFLATIYQALYPKPDKNNDQLKNQASSGSTWKCPNCSFILKIGVIVSDIPTHKCNEHSVRVRELKRIS
jgi:DNA-directed RNA polymerase subunit RPC12/RpoP